MNSPILNNKLLIPPPQAGLLRRNRLFHQLSEGARRKLTFVSAGAGFGKTCLLSSWARQSGLQVYWLSLSEGESDPTRFLIYLVHAIGAFQQDFRDGIVSTILHAPQRSAREALLTTLLNELAALPEEFALVLDDYHFVQSEAVHEVLAFLLKHLPPNLHLMIASRNDFPLPLGRLKLIDQVLELRERELRFTEEESALFFSRLRNLHLSEEDLARALSSTEGWIAGMKLIALSLEDEPKQFESIMRLKGGLRYLFDYLSEEILSRQREEVRDFLFRTAILERFNASLCDALTGQGNGRAMLSELEKANLFIVPLDDERTWFRYHHLFSEFLRRFPSPEQSAWHRSAAVWYQGNGFIEEALGHFVSAKDFEDAGRLIEEAAETMLMRSEVSILKGWLKKLPDEHIRSKPDLCLIQAWTMVLTDQTEHFESYLKEAENQAGAEAIAIRAFVAAMRCEGAIELAQKALEALTPGSFAYNIVSLTLGYEYSTAGRLAESSEVMTRTARFSQQSGDLFTSVLALSCLACNEMTLGHLQQSLQVSRQAIRLASEGKNRPLPVASLPYHGMGSILYERNDLDRSIHYLKESICLDEQWGNRDNMLFSYLVLSRALQAKGEANEAALDAIEGLSCMPELVSYLPWVEFYRVRESLALGELAEVEGWVERTDFSFEEPLNRRRELEWLLLASFHLAQGRPEEARRINERLIEWAERSERLKLLIEGLLLRASIWQDQGELKRAMEAFERALALAEPEGMVRTFLDRGKPVADLLFAFLNRDEAKGKGYARKLLLFMGRKSGRGFSELFSKREIAVLTGLAAGKSNQGIADELGLALSTVKTHLKNIFGKLGVSRRTEAILVARENGLIR